MINEFDYDKLSKEFEEGKPFRHVIIDNFFGNQRRGTNKRWQMVLMKNLITLNENGWSHVKRVA